MALEVGGPPLEGEEKQEHHVKSATWSRLWFKGSPLLGEKKIMERETKREKIEIFAWEVAQCEMQNFWVFFEVYGLLQKLRRICDTWVSAQVKKNLWRLY